MLSISHLEPYFLPNHIVELGQVTRYTHTHTYGKRTRKKLYEILS